MRFKFDPDQQYQLQAIDAVADLFEGEPVHQPEISLDNGAALAAVANRLTIPSETILHNLRGVQTRQELSQDNKLHTLEKSIETSKGELQGRFLNFSVEMETGTGKTYVYLRTALELNRRYGMRKFIIVVPSVAIREGVIKTLEITTEHFAGLYGNPRYQYYEYDSSKLSRVRQFALSSGIEFMVTTIDSFNKKEINVMRRSTDRLQGATPIHMIQGTRPILILDEPQNMKSEKSIRALAALNPLAALRYSATHANTYNLVYRLSPSEAYQKRLVKRVEVASVTTADGLAPNGTDVATPKSVEPSKRALFEAQIRYTIEEHFRKQQRLKDDGLKVLSLFFIDRVANYRDAEGNDGLIRELFDRLFDEIKQKSEFADDWQALHPAEVQAAYFARARKTKVNERYIFQDSKTGRSKKDLVAYNLIMKEKERLLSFDEPTSFIFSHSALREGWDNPNIFQICTLNQSVSEIRKRQEIGRGVRIPVNQKGERVFAEHAAVLTVVANESYEDYVATYQQETATDATNDSPPVPENARERKTIKIRQERLSSPAFQKLWNRISQKSRYRVSIDTERLISQVGALLNQSPEVLPAIKSNRMRVTNNGSSLPATSEVIQPGERSQALPDLVQLINGHLKQSSTPTRLSRATILSIFQEYQAKGTAMEHPHAFAAKAAGAIKEVLEDEMVEAIKYELIDDSYSVDQFVSSFESWNDKLLPSSRSLYDHVPYASNFERQFIEALEERDDVRFFVRLPEWFVVPTPVGEYRPEWAALLNSDSKIKGRWPAERMFIYDVQKSAKRGGLSREERQKLCCARQHFENALDVNFRQVDSGKISARLLET